MLVEFQSETLSQRGSKLRLFDLFYLHSGVAMVVDVLVEVPMTALLCLSLKSLALSALRRLHQYWET